MAKLRQEYLQKEHSELGRLGIRWQEGHMSAPVLRYLLRFTAYHLRWAHEPELLWTLLSTPDYQTAQTTTFKGSMELLSAVCAKGLRLMLSATVKPRMTMRAY